MSNKQPSKLSRKLKAVSIGVTTKSKDKVVPLKVDKTTNSKAAKKKVDKNKQCYIYLGRLKANDKILITQLRYEPFDSVEEAEEWCKGNCTSYEIRNHKSNKTMVKT